MRIKQEILDKFEQFTSYFRYHNKNLTVQQYEIINELSDILDDIVYDRNGDIYEYIEK